MTKLHEINLEAGLGEKYFFSNGNLMNFEVPLEVDFSNIFNNIFYIKTKNFYAVKTSLGVDVLMNGKVYSIIGRVIRIKKRRDLFEVTLKIEFFPEDLLYELEDIFDSVE